MKIACVLLGTMLGVAQHARAQQAHVNLDWNPHKSVPRLNPFRRAVSQRELFFTHFRFVGFRTRASRHQFAETSLFATGEGNALLVRKRFEDSRRNGCNDVTAGAFVPRLAGAAERSARS